VATYVCCAEELPGVVHHYFGTDFECGFVKGQNVPPEVSAKQMKTFCELAVEAGGKPKVSDDIDSIRWRKLCLNVAANGYCALMRIPLRDFWHLDPISKPITGQIMKEVQKVAQPLGYDVPDSHIENMHGFAGADKIGVKPSTMQDVVRGKPLEVETIFGNVVRVARENNIETPTLDSIYGLLRVMHDKNCIEKGYREPVSGYGKGWLDETGKETHKWEYVHLNNPNNVINEKGVDWLKIQGM